MGYNESTQIIVPEGGISTHDVAKCLGVSSLDVGTLCKHSNVNKWAKYKPINFDRLVLNTFAEFAEACRTCKYGLYLKKNPASTNSSSYGSYGSISQMIADAKAGILPTWEYDKPQGGSSSPYRIADFSNYDNTAVAPIAGSRYLHPNIMSDTGSSFYYNFEFEITPERGDYHPLWLKLSDLYGETNQALDFGEMYFGAVIYNDSHYYVITQSTKFREKAEAGEELAGFSLTGITNNDFSVNGSEWTFLPFFSTQPTTMLRDSDGGTTFAGGTKYPFEFAMYKQNIRRYNESTDGTYVINGFSVGMYTDNPTYNNKMYYSLSLTNNSGSAYNGVAKIVINQTNGSYNNQNLILIERAINIPAHSMYNSNNETQYPQGCTLIEVDIPTGAFEYELRQAVRDGCVMATLTWGPNSEQRHSSVIDYGNGSPLNP